MQKKKSNLEKEKGYQSRNKNGGVKNDASKPQLSLVPQLAKLEVAKVMTYGAKKYASFNWMNGFDWTVLSDAAERHLTAFNCGQDLDPETGLHHLAHAACCCLMGLENCYLHPERDDRWPGWKEGKNRQVLENILTNENLKKALNELAKKETK